MLLDRSSHSIRVDPGTGTGADNNRRIQVSISFTSCKAIDGAWSVDWLANIDQIFSLYSGDKLNIACISMTGFKKQLNLKIQKPAFSSEVHDVFQKYKKYRETIFT